jgi:carboxymethylenebutenolidase
MGETIRLTSPADAFVFEAWRERPADARRGGLVAIPAAGDRPDHWRRTAQAFADDGYETIIPILRSRGRPFAHEVRDEVAADLAAVVAALAAPVFAVGWGWGGAAAWLAAARCAGVLAVSAWDPAQLADLLGETPLCPVGLHLARTGHAVAAKTQETFETAHPDVHTHLYEGSATFAPDAARLSRLRTLQIFALNGGGRGDV